MYLRGSKWSMNKRRKRINWFRLILISLLVVACAYIDRYIIARLRHSSRLQPQLAIRIVYNGSAGAL
jgi:hypothetical protein